MRAKRTQPSPTGVQPLLVDISTLSDLTTRSVASLHRDDAAGRIPRGVTVGHAKRWRLEEIKSWIAAGCPDRTTWEAKLAEESSNG